MSNLIPAKRYHFDLGNSTEGAVGYCATVYAVSPEHAVKVLRYALVGYRLDCDGADIIRDDTAGLEHLTVWFNPTAITVADIDSIEDEDNIFFEKCEICEGLTLKGWHVDSQCLPSCP